VRGNAVRPVVSTVGSRAQRARQMHAGNGTAPETYGNGLRALALHLSPGRPRSGGGGPPTWEGTSCTHAQNRTQNANAECRHAAHAETAGEQPLCRHSSSRPARQKTEMQEQSSYLLGREFHSKTELMAEGWHLPGNQQQKPAAARAATARTATRQGGTVRGNRTSHLRRRQRGVPRRNGRNVQAQQRQVPRVPAARRIVPVFRNEVR